jgi:hypothetical protein
MADFKVAGEIHLKISVNGKNVDLRKANIAAFTCERSVNQVPLLKLTMTDGSNVVKAKKEDVFKGLDKFPLGKTLEVKAGIGSASKSIWKGLVTGHKVSRVGQNFVTVLGHGDVIKMTEGVRNQIFEAKDNDTKIIKKVMTDAMGGSGVGDIAKSEIVHTQRYFAYQQTPWRIMMNRVLANGFIFVPATDKKNQVVDVLKLPKGGTKKFKMFEDPFVGLVEKFILGSDITSEITKVSSTAWDIVKQKNA